MPKLNMLVKTSSLLNKFDEKLTRIEEIAVALLLCTMMILIFGAVLERYFIQIGFIWTEELSRYLSVWAAFIGASLAAKKGAHIGIEAFVQMLPDRARKFQNILVILLALTFSLIVLSLGLSLVRRLAASTQLSPAMRINMAWPYAAIPVGSGLMAVHYFIKLISSISDFLSERKTVEGSGQ